MILHVDTVIKSSDHPYGICDSDLKKTELFRLQMRQMKNSIHELFKNKLGRYDLKVDEAGSHSRWCEVVLDEPIPKFQEIIPKKLFLCV